MWEKCILLIILLMGLACSTNSSSYQRYRSLSPSVISRNKDHAARNFTIKNHRAYHRRSHSCPPEKTTRSFSVCTQTSQISSTKRLKCLKKAENMSVSLQKKESFHQERPLVADNTREKNLNVDSNEYKIQVTLPENKQPSPASVRDTYILRSLRTFAHLQPNKLRPFGNTDNLLFPDTKTKQRAIEYPILLKNNFYKAVGKLAEVDVLEQEKKVGSHKREFSTASDKLNDDDMYRPHGASNKLVSSTENLQRFDNTAMGVQRRDPNNFKDTKHRKYKEKMPNRRTKLDTNCQSFSNIPNTGTSQDKQIIINSSVNHTHLANSLGRQAVPMHAQKTPNDTDKYNRLFNAYKKLNPDHMFLTPKLASGNEEEKRTAQKAIQFAKFYKSVFAKQNVQSVKVPETEIKRSLSDSLISLRSLNLSPTTDNNITTSSTKNNSVIENKTMLRLNTANEDEAVAVHSNYVYEKKLDAPWPSYSDTVRAKKKFPKLPISLPYQSRSTTSKILNDITYPNVQKRSYSTKQIIIQNCTETKVQANISFNNSSGIFCAKGIDQQSADTPIRKYGTGPKDDAPEGTVMVKLIRLQKKNIPEPPKICPDAETTVCVRADDNLIYKEKVLPILKAKDCPKIDTTSHGEAIPLIRLKKPNIPEKPKPCQVLVEKCPPRADQNLKVNAKVLPRIVPGPCPKIVQPKLKDSPPLRRLEKPHIPEPPKICLDAAKECTEPRADGKLHIQKMSLPVLEPTFYPPEEKVDTFTEITPLSRLMLHVDEPPREKICENLEDACQRADENALCTSKQLPIFKPMTCPEIKEAPKVTNVPLPRLQKVHVPEPPKVCPDHALDCQIPRADDNLPFSEKQLPTLEALVYPEDDVIHDIVLSAPLPRLVKRNISAPPAKICLEDHKECQKRADAGLKVTPKTLPKIRESECGVVTKQKFKPVPPLQRLNLHVNIVPKVCKIAGQECLDEHLWRADANFKHKKKMLPFLKPTDCPRIPENLNMAAAPLKRLKKVDIPEPEKICLEIHEQCPPRADEIAQYVPKKKSLPVVLPKEINHDRQYHTYSIVRGSFNTNCVDAGECTCNVCNNVFSAQSKLELETRSDIIAGYKIKKKKLSSLLSNFDNGGCNNELSFPKVSASRLKQYRSFSTSAIGKIFGTTTAKRLRQAEVHSQSGKCKKIGKERGTKKTCPSFNIPNCKPRARKSCKDDSDLKFKQCSKMKSPYPSFSECRDEEEVLPITECVANATAYLQPKSPILSEITTAPPPPPHQGHIDTKKEADCVARKLGLVSEGKTSTCDTLDAADKGGKSPKALLAEAEMKAEEEARCLGTSLAEMKREALEVGSRQNRSAAGYKGQCPVVDLRTCSLDLPIKKPDECSKEDQCKAIIAAGVDSCKKSLWQRICDYFKARPNCPPPDAWKKKRLREKAEKAAAAAGMELCDKKQNMCEEEEDKEDDCEEEEVIPQTENPCEQQNKKEQSQNTCQNIIGRKCTEDVLIPKLDPQEKKTNVSGDMPLAPASNCVEKVLPGHTDSSKSVEKCPPKTVSKGANSLQDKCKIFKVDCPPRARKSCKDDTLPDVPCVDVEEAPYSSFSDCHPPFPKIRDTECLIAAKNAAKAKHTKTVEKENKSEPNKCKNKTKKESLPDCRKYSTSTMKMTSSSSSIQARLFSSTTGPKNPTNKNFDDKSLGTTDNKENSVHDKRFTSDEGINDTADIYNAYGVILKALQKLSDKEMIDFLIKEPPFDTFDPLAANVRETLCQVLQKKPNFRASDIFCGVFDKKYCPNNENEKKAYTQSEVKIVEAFNCFFKKLCGDIPAELNYEESERLKTEAVQRELDDFLRLNRSKKK